MFLGVPRDLPLDSPENLENVTNYFKTENFKILSCIIDILITLYIR